MRETYASSRHKTVITVISAAPKIAPSSNRLCNSVLPLQIDFCNSSAITPPVTQGKSESGRLCKYGLQKKVPRHVPQLLLQLQIVEQGSNREHQRRGHEPDGRNERDWQAAKKPLVGKRV